MAAEKWDQLKVTRKRQPLTWTLGIIGEESCNGVGVRGIRICPPAALLWSSEVGSCNPSQLTKRHGSPLKKKELHHTQENGYNVRENIMLSGKFDGNMFNTQYIVTVKFKNNSEQGE